MRHVILNKIADKGFQRLGYEKVKDNDYRVSYETHVIENQFD